MAFEGSTRFEVVGKLGEGGMGIVYEAYDHQRGMYVALKTLRRMDPSSLYRFKREFRAVSDLSHPNIVALHELVAEGDEWFFTMELVRGTNLIDYLRSADEAEPRTRAPAPGRGVDEHTATTQSLPDVPADSGRPSSTVSPMRHVRDLVDLQKLRSVMLQLAGALHALHAAGIVHRDLKPSNVRVTEAGQVSLLDFGIVSEAEAPDGPGDAPAMGTPYYMAPEQIFGERTAAATDWYAFGVILHLALTGFLPFRGARRQVLAAKQRSDPPRVDQLVRGVPEPLVSLCRQLMQRRPSRRPDGAAVLAALGKSGGTDPAFVVGQSRRSFIGRDAELEVLRHGYESASAGRAVSVFIEGESGMGKSALMNAFLSELDGPRGRPAPYVLRGRCHQRESLPYKAFDGAMDGLAKVLASIPERRVRDMLPENVELLAQLFPVLRVVPGIDPPARAITDPRLARARAFEALRTLLARLAAQRMLVLCIDDLQWADGDSLDLLVELSRAPAPAPMLFIASLQTEEIVSSSPLYEVIRTVASRYHGRQIVLGPLSDAEQRSLVLDVLGNHTSEPTLDESFWSESAGNPQLLVELAHHARETAGSERSRIGLADLIRHRVESLSEEAREMLEVVGVSGAPMPLRVISEAAGVPIDKSERAAASLRSAHMVRVTQRENEPWLVPYSPNVRDHMLRLLSAEQRRQRHEHIARALEAQENVARADIALHWSGAGQPRRAVRHLIAGADAALEMFAFDHAAALYRSAIDQHEGADVELLRKLGTALMLVGRSFEAADVFEQAAALAPEREALELERLAADNLLRSGHIERGLELMGSVLRRLGAPFAPTRARAALSLVWHRARMAVRGHRYSARPQSEIDDRLGARLDTLYAAAASLGMIDHIRGAAAQTRHLLDALSLGDERRICRALAIECAYLGAGGERNARRSAELVEQVTSTAQRLQDPYLLAVGLMARGGTAYFTGTPEPAVETLLECDELLRGVRVRAQWERVTARYFLTLAQLAGGDFVGANTTTERALLDAERNRDVYARAMFKCIPNTWTLLCHDRPDAAISSLDNALQGWPTSTFYIAHYVQVFARALIHIYQRDGHSALAAIDDAMPDIRRLLLTRMPWVMGEIHTLRARAGLLVGDERPTRRAIRYLESSGLEYFQGIAATLGAARLVQKSEQAGALSELRRATSLLHSAGAAHLAAAADARAAALSEHAADLDEALGFFRARDVIAPERMLDALCPGF